MRPFSGDGLFFDCSTDTARRSAVLGPDLGVSILLTVTMLMLSTSLMLTLFPTRCWTCCLFAAALFFCASEMLPPGRTRLAVFVFDSRSFLFLTHVLFGYFVLGVAQVEWRRRQLLSRSCVPRRNFCTARETLRLALISPDIVHAPNDGMICLVCGDDVETVAANRVPGRFRSSSPLLFAFRMFDDVSSQACQKCSWLRVFKVSGCFLFGYSRKSSVNMLSTLLTNKHSNGNDCKSLGMRFTNK